MKQGTHSNTNPRSAQYLTHAHSNIIRAVTAMDSCFGLVRPHQHHSRCAEIGLKALCSLFFTAQAGAKHPFTRASSTQHRWELLPGNRTAVPPRHALRRWISLNCRSVCQKIYLTKKKSKLSDTLSFLY